MLITFPECEEEESVDGRVCPILVLRERTEDVLLVFGRIAAGNGDVVVALIYRGGVRDEREGPNDQVPQNQAVRSLLLPLFEIQQLMLLV